MSANAYYIAVEAHGVWHVSDDELLRPRCGDEMVPNLRVPVISEELFRSGYRVCTECDPLAREPVRENDGEAQARARLVQAVEPRLDEEAA